MSLRRFVTVIGVLLGLLVMHALAPGHPTAHKSGDTSAMAFMPMPGDSVESSQDPSALVPADHDDAHLDQVCVAVLQSSTVWLLLALGLALLVLRRRPAHSSARPAVQQLRSFGIDRPPDLTQLCVLRI